MNLLKRLGFVAGLLLLGSGCTSTTELGAATPTRAAVAEIEPTVAASPTNTPTATVPPAAVTPETALSTPTPVPPTPTAEPTPAPLPTLAAVAEQDHSGLAGTRGLTVQWISWEPEDWGTIEFIPLVDGSYAVSGTQVGPKGDFVSVDGTIVPVSERELLFSGEVVVQVSFTNQGQPCVRSGDITFLATGDRRFWRMQDLLNCDDVVTDYVDIYFG